ncbi:1-deoxy-D-xylulose-5-phosphate synthase [Basilea psittacipulmonis DSM 24701]|uniref:1-deoxy-D-xylulose-5-phosphate synthase n=2 Tax=Basilea TaxID=1472344 RepID=A0A077DD46_9BURK|nr:1-deoxy-D-xylulose-5-phosphate synthase [Basilea psittacipulmonis DSM 24701]
MFELLEKINHSSDVKLLNNDELKILSKQLRDFIVQSVSSTGGHLSSNLGTVELTVALHHVFNFPTDRLIWDVGHQSYPHKILTGRREKMSALRQKGGISGFPKRSESEYDAFGTAHSSTSISAALGMAVAARHLGQLSRQHIAVIGDGAMTAGMAFEALNNAGVTPNINLLVILNDNDMSISPPVGALNKYLSRLHPLISEASDIGKTVLEQLPMSDPLIHIAKKLKSYAKGITGHQATLFEDLGFEYIGPIDGHDVDTLIPVLENIRYKGGLHFLHVITKKGQGYKLAEADPVLYHGPGKFDPQQGIVRKASNALTFSQIFGQWLCDMAQKDSRLVGITPAMREGSGMVAFDEQFPYRYFDVGIAEQHAVTFAAGLACDETKPVVAIYSTFLQRAYDQLIHDVALQNLDVTFAIDRAGLVGADGATHAGNYDIAFLRCIPNMVIACPSDEFETRMLLNTCYHYPGPASVRYPRGSGTGVDAGRSLETLPIGKAHVKYQGQKVAILAFGTLLQEAMPVAQKHGYTLVDMRFVKPLDTDLIDELARTHTHLVTIEDGCRMGGAGSAVLEYVSDRHKHLSVLNLAYPDQFIDHGDQQKLHEELGLTEKGIETSIQSFLGLE